ncbi:uncharacterized protein LOC134815219 [Bolinopsis microptera]|uniref:uncharacterized protein LOC134815219 n=1 Tax=Bolinopsis microptera TaxID=2820187 RepID=UPI00307982FC
MEFPDLPTATRLPGVEEMWTGYIATGGEVAVLVITSLVLALVAVFLFFLHRSNVLITFSRLSSEDGISPSKHSLIISGMIPTLSLCLTCTSVLLPRSSLLLLSFSKLSRVAWCYQVLVECIRECGGQVCVFRLTRLTHSNTSIREYKGRHSTLSLSVTLLTVEVLLVSTLHLLLLLLSYNTLQPIYPHNLLQADTLILCYYSGVSVAAILGVVAACKVVGVMSKPWRVVAVVKAVSLVMLVGEAVMTMMVTGDEWRDSAVVFLTRNCLVTVLIQSVELVVIIILGKTPLKRAKQSVRSVMMAETELSMGTTSLDNNTGGIKLRLNKEDSVELLRALNLGRYRSDEGLRVMLSTDRSRRHHNSLTSVATVC